MVACGFIPGGTCLDTKAGICHINTSDGDDVVGITDLNVYRVGIVEIGCIIEFGRCCDTLDFLGHLGKFGVHDNTLRG